MIFLIIFNWNALSLFDRGDERPRNDIFISFMQTFLLAVSLHNIYVQSQRFDNGTPVSVIYQGMAWVIAGN